MTGARRISPEHVCAQCSVTFTRPPHLKPRFCGSKCYHLSTRNAASQQTILDNSMPEPNSGCWLWLGSLTTAGYGTISTGMRYRLAHRLSYEAFHSDAGVKFVCHRCDNRACVNPDHLEPGSQKDNMEAASRRGRMQHGSARWSAKLHERDIPTIRQRLAAGELCTEIAPSYGVHPDTISLIKRDRIWRRA